MKKRGFLILVGILVPLVLGEIFLRVTHYGEILPTLQFDVKTRANVEAGYYVPDNQLFWRRSDLPLTEFEKAINLVRVGDPAPENDDRFRIICLGDSCTKLVIQGWPYSFLVQQYLGSDRVQVFNASLPGYTSHQGLAWLRLQLADFAPDLLVIYFGWNDHWRSTGMSDRDYAASLSRWHLRLLSLLHKDQRERPLRVSMQEFQDNLLQMDEIVQARGGKVVLLTGPSHINQAGRWRLLEDRYIQDGDEPERLHREYMAVVRALQDSARASGIRVVDVASVFDDLNAPELLLHADGIHPTDTGHTVIAATLTDFIERRCLDSLRPAQDPAGLGSVVLAQEYSSQGQWAQAVQQYRRAVVRMPRELGPHLGLAWLLATCPDPQNRDAEEAVGLLEPWRQQSDPSPEFLDVLAAALAADGQYAAAAAMADEAVLRSESIRGLPQEVVAAMRERAALYAAGRPYRLPPPSEP